MKKFTLKEIMEYTDLNNMVSSTSLRTVYIAAAIMKVDKFFGPCPIHFSEIEMARSVKEWANYFIGLEEKDEEKEPELKECLEIYHKTGQITI